MGGAALRRGHYPPQESGPEGVREAEIGTKRTWPIYVVMSAPGGIVLQKSFWGVERKFLEPLMRFTRGDVRDRIASSKIDHGPSWRL